MQKKSASHGFARHLGLAGVAMTAALGVFADLTPASAQAGPELGVWVDDTGKGAVEIKPCGDKLCGFIYWLKEPLGTDGQPRIDRNNPDEAKRTRPICGLQVLGNLAKMSEGGYDSGWVYDPKVGKTYDSAIDLTGKDQLTVTGYRAMRILGKSFVWTRAPADLPACGQTTGSTGGETLPWQKAGG